MIKATCLRVNNLLEYYISTDNLGWIISEIDWQDIKECQENPISFNADNRGIELTEDWLLKFGFTKNETYSFIKIYSGLELMNISEKYFRANLRGVSIRKEIKYVHQLQNLHLALTGEELTIKTKYNE
jgi:hypothetical protein